MSSLHYTNIKLDFSYNYYLSDCDLINKYNLKSSSQKPKLEQIVLDFPLKDLAKASDRLTKTDLDSDIQLKSFLVFYLITTLIPYINCNKTDKSFSNTIKDSDANYSIKVVLSSSEDINSFLYVFFIEIWSGLISENFNLFKKIKNNPKILLKKNILNSKIPSVFFFEINQSFTKIIPEINIKELNINTNFLFSDFILEKNFKNTIRNLPFFWIG